MKKRRKRHSPEQIVKKLRDANVMLTTGKSLEEVLKVELGEAMRLERFQVITSGFIESGERRG